jgi:hypothetical protein
MKSAFRYIGLAVISIMCAGCIMVPIIDTFNRSGLTAEQRTAKLPLAVKDFQDAVFWGETQLALRAVVPEARNKIRQVLERFPGEERVVESKMVSADYGEEAYEAEVVVETKSYPKESLIVHKRRAFQRWEFHIGTGWRLLDLRELPVQSGLA